MAIHFLKSNKHKLLNFNIEFSFQKFITNILLTSSHIVLLAHQSVQVAKYDSYDLSVQAKS